VAEARGSQDSVIEPKLDGMEAAGRGDRRRRQALDAERQRQVEARGEDRGGDRGAVPGRYLAGWGGGDDEHRGRRGSSLGEGAEHPRREPEAARSAGAADLRRVRHDGARRDRRSVAALLHERRSLLETAFGNGEWERVSLVPQYPAVEETHEILLAQGFEGSMVKHLKARYASGQRGKGMGKIKGKWSLDAFIIGSEPGEGDSWIAKEGLIGTVVFAQHDENGKVVERGRCSGMSYEMRKWLTENLDALIAKKQVIEVTHNGVMPSGDPASALHPGARRQGRERGDSA
jgi:hypothetical protein